MNKKGFTLIEVAVSVVLVSIVMVSLTATLVEIKKKSETVSANTNAVVYSSVISKSINSDIIKNDGIKFAECDAAGGECGLVLGNNQRRWLGIKDTTDGREVDIYQDSAENNYYLKTKTGGKYVGVVSVEASNGVNKSGSKINCSGVIKANCLSVTVTRNGSNSVCTCFKEKISSTLIYLDNTPLTTTSLVTTNNNESNNQVADYNNNSISIKYIKTLSFVRTYRKDVPSSQYDYRVSTEGYGFSRIYYNQDVFQDARNAQSSNVLTRLTIGIYDGIDKNDQSYNVVVNSASRIDKDSPKVGTKFNIDLDTIGNLPSFNPNAPSQGVYQPTVTYDRAGTQPVTRITEKFNVGYESTYYSSGETKTITGITMPYCNATGVACTGRHVVKYTTGENCAGVTVIDQTGRLVVPSNYFTEVNYDSDKDGKKDSVLIHACWQ